jgi:hypothetical protein
MTEEQPQLFLIPATVLTQIVNHLAEQPFKLVAPLLSMIDRTVKEYKEPEDGSVS